jgi:hypothetical protein
MLRITSANAKFDGRPVHLWWRSVDYNTGKIDSLLQVEGNESKSRGAMQANE